MVVLGSVVALLVLRLQAQAQDALASAGATAAAVGGDGSSRHLRAEALLALLGVALAILVSTLYS